MYNPSHWLMAKLDTHVFQYSPITAPLRRECAHFHRALRSNTGAISPILKLRIELGNCAKAGGESFAQLPPRPPCPHHDHANMSRSVLLSLRERKFISRSEM